MPRVASRRIPARALTKIRVKSFIREPSQYYQGQEIDHYRHDVFKYEVLTYHKYERLCIQPMAYRPHALLASVAASKVGPCTCDNWRRCVVKEQEPPHITPVAPQS